MGGRGKHQATSFPFYPPPLNNLPPRLCQPHLLPRPGSLPIPSHTRPRPQLTTPRGGDPTDPMTAKAGSSCRSKGKSIRKLVLKRAVMVTTGEKGRGSRIEDRGGGAAGPHRKAARLTHQPLPPTSPDVSYLISVPCAQPHPPALRPSRWSYTLGSWSLCCTAPQRLPPHPIASLPAPRACAPGPPLPASLFHTASTRNTKALNVAAKNPRQ